MYEPGGRWGQSLFRPDGLRRWALLPTGGVAPEQPLCACLNCGLLWSRVPVQSLKEFLIKHGTNKTKESYGLQDEA